MGNNLRYQRYIQQSIQKSVLLPIQYKQPKRSQLNLDYQSLQMLDRFNIYISSKQIESNTSIRDQIDLQFTSMRQQQQFNRNNQWPYSCIGLIYTKQIINKKQYIIYGTGTLIHNNIIITTAQNVYSRRYNKPYTNIKFIPGLMNNKHAGVYEIKQIYYPIQYVKLQRGFQQFNFAILQIFDDLNEKNGYLGYITEYQNKLQEIYIYQYMFDHKSQQFKMYEKKTKSKIENFINYNYSFEMVYGLSGSPVLIKDQSENYYVIAIKNSSYEIYLRREIQDIINKWTLSVKLNLQQKDLSQQICKQLTKFNFKNLKIINLNQNNIEDKGCEYLIQANLPNLTTLLLKINNIGADGCKYLKNSNWPELTQIDLSFNKIGNRGCSYLKDSKWPSLLTINLYDNMFGASGCKYLTFTNWPRLTTLNLGLNKIGPIGCQYLKDSNWVYLKNLNLWNTGIDIEGCRYLQKIKWVDLIHINLYKNNIGDEFCKYLKQSNWYYLKIIILWDNNITDIGCKYLRDTNWINLTIIDLNDNQITNKGCFYLKDTNWPSLIKIDIQWNEITIFDRYLLKELWPNAYSY